MKVLWGCFSWRKMAFEEKVGPEILPDDDNNALFVDGGLICVQRLHPGCGRRKKHTFLSGGQKHLSLADRSFLRISSSMIKVAMAASLSWPLTASSIAGEIFAHEDQVLWCRKSASGGVFKDMLALNLIMIDLPCLAPESWEVSSGVMRDHLRRSKKLAPESHKISFKVMRGSSVCKWHSDTGHVEKLTTAYSDHMREGLLYETVA
ncbi:hypothetical protein TIFTF001_044993 [Ficus carica]|uniref:Uncharacterized protein n=1 Tax=Ficus carica TaxID=3494 RepID=A0AA88A0M1_FICCA|nr:hypothetical protein TIFTF001_044993 [Ficus carica]